MSPNTSSLRIVALRALSTLALCALVVTPVAALAQAVCRPPAMHNFLPTVTSVTAQGGFVAPATLILTASADDSDGSIVRVDFFDSFQGNNTLIGTATTGPYSFTWANVPSGAHTLTAKATDNRGGQTTSTPMSVYVTARVTYLHTDHLNTPRVATDATNKVIWRWAPAGEPFGNSVPEEDPDVDGQNFTLNLRMPGQYFDRETGTFYNYFRDYDPAIGRYIQSDPIGLAAGVNTYLYVDGNPLSDTDPEGLQKGGIQLTWPVPYTPPQSTSAPRYDPAAAPRREASKKDKEQQRANQNNILGARLVCVERSCKIPQELACTPSNASGQPRFSSGPFVSVPGAASQLDCPCLNTAWVVP